MVNLVRIGPTTATDDPQIEAARQQIALALQTQQEANRGVAGVPLAQGAGAVQAKYGMGNALVDLANRLAASYAVGQANKNYQGKRDQQDARIENNNQAMLDAVAPATAGSQKSTPITLDSLSSPAPAQGFAAPDLSQGQQPSAPTPLAPQPADPAVTMNEQTAVPMQQSAARQMIASAMAGMDARSRGATLSSLLLQRALPKPDEPFNLNAGATRNDAKGNVIASNPKEVTPVRAERKTRVLGNDMAQDYNFYGDGRPDENVGGPYRHKDPSATIVNMNDPATAARLENDAQQMAKGRSPYEGVGGRNMGPYWAQVRERAVQLNPGLDASLYKKRQGAESSFASGVDGRNMDPLNTIAQHIQLGKQAYAALQNGQLPALNALANTLGIQSGDAAPAVYRNIMTFLGNETARATIGGQNGEADRDRLAQMFSMAANPDSAAGNFDAAAKLIGGRFASTRKRFQSATAVYDPEQHKMVEDPTEFDAKLTPAALAFEKMGALSQSGADQPGIAGTHVTQNDIAAEIARRQKARGG